MPRWPSPWGWWPSCSSPRGSSWSTRATAPAQPTAGAPTSDDPTDRTTHAVDHLRRLPPGRLGRRRERQARHHRLAHPRRPGDLGQDLGLRRHHQRRHGRHLRPPRLHRVALVAGVGLPDRLLRRHRGPPGLAERSPAGDRPARTDHRSRRPRTGTAPWAASMSITTDETWPPGQYLLRLETSDAGRHVRPDGHPRRRQPLRPPGAERGHHLAGLQRMGRRQPLRGHQGPGRRGHLRSSLHRQRERRVPRSRVRVHLDGRATRPRRVVLDRHRPARTGSSWP